MREATVTELRDHTKSYFDAVEHGETVRVYRDGRPIADIVPIRQDPPAWKRPPRARLWLKGVSLSDEIVADREEG